MELAYQRLSAVPGLAERVHGAVGKLRKKASSQQAALADKPVAAQDPGQNTNTTPAKSITNLGHMH